MLSADNIFNGRDSLSGSSMCKHHLSIGIPNAIKVWNDFATIVFGEYLHFFIDSHESTLSFNSHSFQSHVAGVRDASSSYHGGVYFECFNVLFGFCINHFDGDRLFTRNTGSYFGGEDPSSIVDGTVTNQHTFSLFGDFSVKSWHQVWKSLNECDLTSQCSINIREFKTNVTRSDDCNPLRDKLKFQSTIRSVHGLLVHSDTRRDKWD
mmetsp:Transcript_12119/g.34728  ORF Transcript_12119/g.34728 Transcript_12119/m.34728 type:complete len:208 (+) Transcript_12119:451-1074(+)